MSMTADPSKKPVTLDSVLDAINCLRGTLDTVKEEVAKIHKELAQTTTVMSSLVEYTSRARNGC